MAAQTILLEVTNNKGEVMAQVRGLSNYDAHYISGVSPEYMTGSTQSTTRKTTTQLTKVKETR